MRGIALCAAAAFLAYAIPAEAQPPAFALSATPAATALTLPAGISKIGTAWVYRPANASGAMPLMVALHGAGGDARRFLEVMRGAADRHGFAVIAPQSEGPTWDLVRQRRFGPDVQRIDAVLTELFAKLPVDRERLIVAGFSDGASYALSLGVANPQLFRSILALSPGFTWVPSRGDPTQRIVIAHGRRDEILPPANIDKHIVPDLSRAGYRPQVRWFDGRHTIDRRALDEGLAIALGHVP